MTSVRTNFDGMDGYVAAMVEVVNDGVTSAAMAVSETMREQMTQVRQSDYLIGTHSSPGGVPFVQTARLRDSIGWTNAQNLTARAGSDLGNVEARTAPDGTVNDARGYGYYLEYGTSNMAARPWARRGLYRAINSGRAHRLFMKAAKASAHRHGIDIASGGAA